MLSRLYRSSDWPGVGRHIHEDMQSSDVCVLGTFAVCNVGIRCGRKISRRGGFAQASSDYMFYSGRLLRL